MGFRETEAQIINAKDAMINAKEFKIPTSTESTESMDRPVGQCTTCSGPNCMGPCVQKCMPNPPNPNCR